MKLSELRAAIRKTKGNPAIRTQLTAGGPFMTLPLQKTPLLEALGAAYNDERSAETGLTFNETNGLISSVDEAVEIDDDWAGEPVGAEIIDEDLL